jgi:nucleotide-binding universal stress UspA family protein
VKQEKSKSLTKILLALDGSGISRNTAKISIEMAKIFEREITGLYVIDEELVVNDYADYRNELGVEELSISRAEKAALFETLGHEILEWLKSDSQRSGSRLTTEMGIGGVEKIVLEQAEKASILAIGRRGKGHPDSSDYLGTNFRHIAHRSKIPLLVGGDRVKPIKRILVAYNGKERAQKALDWAGYFQKHGSFEMLSLVVQEEDSASVRAWEKDIEFEFKQNKIENFQLITQRGQAADRIAETAVKSGSDLVIMGGYRHKALLEWLEGSTLDSVLKKMSLPVLVA